MLLLLVSFGELGKLPGMIKRWFGMGRARTNRPPVVTSRNQGLLSLGCSGYSTGSYHMFKWTLLSGEKAEPRGELHTFRCDAMSLVGHLRRKEASGYVARNQRDEVTVTLDVGFS